jgi:hypothetical protein
MMWDHHQAPTPEQLTAYHDGELNPAERAAVDAWLVNHPEEAADLAAWRRVDTAWKETRPDIPGDDVWSGVRRRIDKGLADSPRRGPGWWLALGAAAAVLLVAAGWALWPPKPTPPKPIDDLPIVKVPDDEVIEVARPGDIRIISMDGSGYVDIDGQQACCIIGAELPVPDQELRPTSIAATKVLEWSPGMIPHEKWGVPMMVDQVVLQKDWQP